MSDAKIRAAEKALNYLKPKINSKSILGIGTGSTVRRIICNINTALSGIDITSPGNFIGNYSWGTITVAGSRNGKSFEFYNQNGLLGIETSAHISRSLQLKQVY